MKKAVESLLGKILKVQGDGDYDTAKPGGRRRGDDRKPAP